MYSKVPKFFANIAVILMYVIACGGHAQAQRGEKKPVFVIVHGAWGGSWAFRKVDSLMTAKDYIVYRPSLTGLGERVHLASPDVTLNTHIADVVNTILFEELTEIVLVGHSYGGMVITGVADRVPDRIRKLIYLDAMVPDDGETVIHLMDPKGDGLSRMIEGDYLIPLWVKRDQNPPKDVPHPLKTFLQPIELKNQKRSDLPSAYILTVAKEKKAEEDDFAPFAERARQRGWPVFHMQADHNPQWSAAEELVKMLLELQ